MCIDLLYGFVFDDTTKMFFNAICTNVCLMIQQKCCFPEVLNESHVCVWCVKKKLWRMESLTGWSKILTGLVPNYKQLLSDFPFFKTPEIDFAWCYEYAKI